MTKKTRTEGLETQQQHAVLLSDSIKPSTQAMHPTSTTTDAAAMPSLSHLVAPVSSCIQSATRAQASHAQASGKVALTFDVPSMADVAPVETDKQTMNTVGVQPKSTLQAAMASIKHTMSTGNLAGTNEPGMNGTMATDTGTMRPFSLVGATDTQQPLLLTVLEPGPVAVNFIQQLDSDSALAVFGTCTATRDMVLRESHSVSVGGHVLQDGARQHLLKALQLASKHGSNTSLILNMQSHDGATSRWLTSESESGIVPDGQVMAASDEHPEAVSVGEPEAVSVEESKAVSDELLEAVSDEEPDAVSDVLSEPVSVSDADAVSEELLSEGGSEWLPLINWRVSVRSHALLHEAYNMGLLQGVSKLELVGVYLDSPLPSVPGRTLPNLETLALCGSVVSFSKCVGPIGKGACMPAFLKLQTLQLRNVGWCGPIQQWKQQLSKQLALLPALNSLSLTAEGSGGWGDTKYGTLYSMLVKAAASQLTHLELDWDGEETMGVEKVWHVAELSSRLSLLRSLSLGLVPGDDEMLQLLALPHLTHVSLPGLRLSHSFAEQQCRWRVLEMREVGLEGLAWLPLHPDLLIKGWLDHPLRCSVPAHSGTTVEDIDRSGWRGFCDVDVVVTAEQSYYSEYTYTTGNDANLLQALPLLSGASLLSLDMWHLSAAGFSALGKFAAQQKHRFHMEVLSTCTWYTSDISALVSRMPAGSHLTVGDDRVDALIQVCCAAKGRITVHVKFDRWANSGFGERVKAALAACGQHDAVVTDLGRVCNKTGGGWCWEWVVKGR